jgi:hypothetical protein
MDCTVVVLPSVPLQGLAIERAKVEVATGGDMSRADTGSVDTERTARHGTSDYFMRSPRGGMHFRH